MIGCSRFSMKIASLTTTNIVRRYLSTTRCGPRPFPSAYNIGVDIAELRRFNRFVPQISESLDALPGSPVVHSADQPYSLDYKSNSGTLEPLKPFIRKIFNYVEWSEVRPRLLQYLNEPVLNRRKFIEFLASRWAVKEAAIKAHSHRRLSYRDVIIGSVPMKATGRYVPVALINPARPMVIMSSEIAKQRGLITNGDGHEMTQHRRSASTTMSERQVARLSISHDGGYAIAVVQALDEPVSEQVPESLTDDGSGEPLHEPLIGDEGWNQYDLAEALGDFGKQINL